jgi:hypothetical protein
MRITSLALIVTLLICPFFSIDWVAKQNTSQATSGENICATTPADGLGCVDGTVDDTEGHAVKNIEVELIPTFKAGDSQWYSTLHEWTNEFGKYEFERVEPGEYLLAVHHETAPDERFPFASAYYPGVEQERDAGPVKVTASSRTALAPLRLRRLGLLTIAIEVIWSDGTRPIRSNVLFHNASYPDQAVIGDVAPQVDNGQGQFALPMGFQYIVSAKVDCDAGKHIESQESNRVPVRISDDSPPTRLILTLPGQPCALWSPR